MNRFPQILNLDLDVNHALAETRSAGYYFADEALRESMRVALLAEADRLDMEYADHVAQPINAGKSTQVRQQHERFYAAYGDSHVPVASLSIDGLALAVSRARYANELPGWHANEIGYQRYYANSGFIDPHRDRASDQMLSVTFTLEGSAEVRIFETMGDPNDYLHLEEVNNFRTTPGSIMLLRAPGFGEGEQVIHQVMPPEDGERTILNLRMRPTILPQPGTITDEA